jgi:hypothetical protein
MVELLDNKRTLRLINQSLGDDKIREERKGSRLITKYDSLNDRVKKLGLEVKKPVFINRKQYRQELSTAVHLEMKGK